MKRFLFIAFFILASCVEKAISIEGQNLYKYNPKNIFFDPSIFTTTSNLPSNPKFPSGSYSRLLAQLDEKSLTNGYKGHDIIRVTALRSFESHFTIRIDNYGSNIVLTSKRTFRDSKSLGTDKNNNPILEDFVFDSLRGSYFLVKYVWLPNSFEELDRKKVNPITELKTKKIDVQNWNYLVDLLSKNEFFKMSTTGEETGFDGDHFLLEVHTGNGYYIVDRWSPRKGGFKELITMIQNYAN